MAEDFDNHRRIFDACPEPVEGAAMIFKLPPQFGQCSMSMSKTRLSSLAQLSRAGAPCACTPSVKTSVSCSRGLGVRRLLYRLQLFQILDPHRTRET